MKIAAAYIRVSTDDQLEYSPDSQLVQIRRYAKANGFTPARGIHLYRRRGAFRPIQRKASRVFANDFHRKKEAQTL